MAGVMMTGDEGREVGTQSVASIGGPAKIVAGGHVEGNGGPEYNENPGVDLTTKPYPAGTDFGEASNPLRP